MVYNKCPKCIHAGNKCQHVVANTLETLFYLKNMVKYNCNIEIDLNCKDFELRKVTHNSCDGCRHYKFNDHWNTYFCYNNDMCIHYELWEK